MPWEEIKRGIVAFLLGFAFVGIGMMLAHGHESWISEGGLRNSDGEWCCGEGDCFIVAAHEIHGGYHVGGVQVVNGHDKHFHEFVPYSEAQPSPDGQFWRCKRPDGSRRCFFAPPPNM